jgi:flagellar hook protein FlgE
MHSVASQLLRRFTPCVYAPTVSRKANPDNLLKRWERPLDNQRQGEIIMSVYGLMRTGASGMMAQSDRLATVADNIANSSTVGYKAGNTEFSSLLIDSAPSSYNSGGVETSVRYGISRQGTLSFTASPYDLAINGGGFMLVADPSGAISLTRAGAFVPDGDGHLVNSAGFKLLGYPVVDGVSSAVIANGTAGLVPIDIQQIGLEAAATTTGILTANLPAGAANVPAANLPSANTATSVSSGRSSVVVYDSLGGQKQLDVHYAKTAAPGEWEVTVYDVADRSATGSFPYANAALASSTLIFDANGQLDPSSPTSLSIPVPGGATMALDVSKSSQLAADYSVLAVNTNGSGPSAVTAVKISNDGTVSETYANGTTRAKYRVPLATVISPDQLAPKSGNIYQTSNGSGDLRVGFAGAGGLGKISSGALENSTVDIAHELTDMIEAQRNYTANSKVFQTGAELLETLVNLKR